VAGLFFFRDGGGRGLLRIASTVRNPAKLHSHMQEAAQPQQTARQHNWAPWIGLLLAVGTGNHGPFTFLPLLKALHVVESEALYQS